MIGKDTAWLNVHSRKSKLKVGEGETFTGEGILALTKALLEAGVGYVGGYQGAPISI
jgi:TPP-dependent indolepyruvate ferredoxin oxidoreductase alpha subunit